jgi:glycine cleavage system H protein
MNFPSDLKYSEDHEWIRVDGTTGTIGITDHAQKELGDIVYVDFYPTDGVVSKTGIFGSVEAVKTVSDLFMPVSGTITATNKETLDGAPESVNKDPYNTGWMIKIEMSDISELDSLMDADAYQKYIGVA